MRTTGLVLAIALLCAGLCAAAEFKSDEAKNAVTHYEAAIKAAKVKYAADMAAAKAALDEKIAAADSANVREAFQKESELIMQELVRLQAELKGEAAPAEPKQFKTDAARKAGTDCAVAMQAAKKIYLQDLLAAQKVVLAKKGASDDAAVKEAYQQELDLIDEELKQLGGGPQGAKSKAGSPDPSAKKPPAKPAPAELTLDLGGVTMKMVLIRPGKFMMGEKRPRQPEVTISKPFYMGETEVTQTQYYLVTGTYPNWYDLGDKGPTNPVSKVSWHDAAEFCKKLKLRVKTHPTIRLPTEAEWEYACRAGTQTAFFFGDDPSALGDYAWHWRNSGNGAQTFSHPVGQKKPNAWGLYDMLGNVQEWCADWSGYEKGPATDPSGPASGKYRVVRGGWYGHGESETFRSAYSSCSEPASRSAIIGFRCAMNLP